MSKGHRVRFPVQFNSFSLVVSGISVVVMLSVFYTGCTRYGYDQLC